MLKGLHSLFWQQKPVQLMHSSVDESKSSLFSTTLALQGEDNMISDLNRFQAIISICNLF